MATEDERIAAAVRNAGGEAILTSPGASSGTDRLAEAARSVAADVYVNIQGDEPMMSSENVDRAIERLDDDIIDFAGQRFSEFGRRLADQVGLANAREESGERGIPDFRRR